MTYFYQFTSMDDRVGLETIPEYVLPEPEILVSEEFKGNSKKDAGLLSFEFNNKMLENYAEAGNRTRVYSVLGITEEHLIAKSRKCLQESYMTPLVQLGEPRFKIENREFKITVPYVVEWD